MATKTSHFVRPLVALVALVAAMAALLIAYGASPVHAAGSCTTTSGTTTCTFAYTGASQSWTVPPGVTQATFDVFGAQGGSEPSGKPGGLGGEATATIAVVNPGDTLQVNVGGEGGNGTTTQRGVGGFNGGGDSGSPGGSLGAPAGGGGGGASDVRSGAFGLDNRIIVAGGGGGAGGFGGAGGVGGGLFGTAGGDATSVFGTSGGGGGGTSSAGGSGGVGSGGNGSAGRSGFGGDGGSGSGDGSGGGAGGGGYYGGGGGGGGASAADGGGGGGGSGFGPSGVLFNSGVRSGDGLVTISYTTPPADTTPPVLTVPGPITVEATSPDGAVVTFNATAEDAVDGSVGVTCTPPSGSTFPIGTTSVSCSATDTAGNNSTATFSVTVQDTTAPKVTSTSPRDGGEVGPAANIRATFSEEMQSASVVNAFKLFKKGSTNRIAAQVTYDAMTDTATLNPTNNLKRGATYKAVVTTVAKDEAGNRLDQDDSGAGLQQKVWFFEID